jgi:hypothetical protein
MVVALFGGCNRAEPSAVREVSDVGASELPLHSATAAGSVASTPLAHIEHWGCLGSCPVYQIDVWDDGRVEYEGRHHVKVRGHATAQLSDVQMAKLRVAFEKGRFDSLDEKRVEMMDTPTTIIAYRTPAGVHSVQDLGQPEMRELGAAFAKIVDETRWIGTDEERPLEPSPIMDVLRGIDDGGIPDELARAAAANPTPKGKKRRLNRVAE